MSLKAINWALRVQCSPTQKLVLLVLANHANDEGYCFPSNDLLVKATCLSIRAVRGAKLALTEKGLIEKAPDYCRNALRVRVGMEGETPAKTAPRTPKTASHSVKEAHPAGLGKKAGPAAEAAHYAAPAAPSAAAIDNPHTTLNNGHEQTHCQKDPKQPEDNPSSAEYDRFDEFWFEEFWAHYPRKVARQAARLAWKAALRIAPPELIITSLKKYKFSHEPQYQPHPRTWLHQRRWEDIAWGQNMTDTAPSRKELSAKTKYEQALKEWLMKRSFGETAGPKPELADFMNNEKAAA